MTQIDPLQTAHPLCADDEPVVTMPAPVEPQLEVDPARFTGREWEIWHAAYCAGHADGAAVERAETFAIVDDAARSSVRRTAKSPDYATLWERRGNLARAAAVRDDWRRRDELVEAAGGWGGGAR
ncbi:hypothetical protein [Kineococcus aurantiacus]|uniref:Uncharacterized protein n=1 Tax=Kineococcus aurantiacus TaxID=37633 RepID=A0A7Y9ASH6_9ACTN|nr:hypothetical protein [Kineococcus aurantiacus]NYD20941.1 hypothetical protein [Kineococcus aurantiacus]